VILKIKNGGTIRLSRATDMLTNMLDNPRRDPVKSDKNNADKEFVLVTVN